MTVGGATEETLHVRRTLAEEGVVTIVCIVDPDTGKLTEDPDYLAHGFPPERDGLLGGHAGDPEGPHQGGHATASRTWSRSRSSSAGPRPPGPTATHRRSPLIIPVIVDA